VVALRYQRTKTSAFLKRRCILGLYGSTLRNTLIRRLFEFYWAGGLLLRHNWKLGGECTGATDGQNLPGSQAAGLDGREAI